MKMREKTDSSMSAPWEMNDQVCGGCGSNEKTRADGAALSSDREGSEGRDAFSEKPPASDLQKIPGVGANMERHLHNIGIRCIADLKGRKPEELYHLDSVKKGFQDDKCVLYVFRCAVYFAEHEQHDSEKLKWWYWKDKDYPE